MLSIKRTSPQNTVIQPTAYDVSSQLAIFCNVFPSTSSKYSRRKPGAASMASSTNFCVSATVCDLA